MKVKNSIEKCGFSGAVTANKIATELDKGCLLLMRKIILQVIATTMRMTTEFLCINMAHIIFHTNSKNVWQFSNQFTKW
jgi:UDP-galactopyranose mutase